MRIHRYIGNPPAHACRCGNGPELCATRGNQKSVLWQLSCSICKLETEWAASKIGAIAEWNEYLMRDKNKCSEK